MTARTPLTDPRDFGPVLRDWLLHHGWSFYRAARAFQTTERSVGRWAADWPCSHERAYRGLMTAIDAGLAGTEQDRNGANGVENVANARK